MDTLNYLQELDFLLGIFKHYNNYIINLSLVDDEDNRDILSAKTVIVSEITTILNKLKSGILSPDMMEKLVSKVTESCGNIIDTPPATILADTYADNLISKLEGKVIINPQSNFRTYKENTLSSLLKQIDTIIISRTTDNQAYLVTVIDSKELVHNVYQLRSDALGYEEFYKHIRNNPYAKVLGENISQIVPKEKESNPLSLLNIGIEPRISIPEPIINPDEKISLAEIINITSATYKTFDKLRKKFFRDYINQFIGTSESDKGRDFRVYLSYDPEETELFCDKVTFHFETKLKPAFDRAIYLKSIVELKATYDREKEDINLKINIFHDLAHHCMDKFTPSKKFSLQDYTIKHHLDDLLTLFKFMENKSDFFSSKRYSFANITVRMEYDKISVFIDNKNTIEYDAQTNKYDINSGSVKILEELKTNYQNILREIYIPVSECPIWMSKEIAEYLNPEKDLSLILEKK